MGKWLGLFLAAGVALVLVVVLTARSCGASKPSEERVLVVPPKAEQPEAPQQAAPQQQAHAEPGRQPGDSLLHGPADYLRTTTITIPRYARKTVDVASVQNEIKQFYALQGRYPKSLDELAQWRGEPLPETPKGYVYVYDPASGKVDVVPAE